jgi:SAM-dependent methyltransferase
VSDVARHYGSSDLFDRIVGALEAAGLSVGELDADQLAGVDEFHLGGRSATDALLADVGLRPGSSVVDVGCGIGGAARVTAGRGCTVVGVDLTPEFVDVAVRLAAALGLDEMARFEIGNALELPVDDAWADVATLLHVGMNIADKGALMKEVARVLRTGGTFAVYDIMRVGDGDIAFPVPWASSVDHSFVVSPEEYVEALQEAGFVEPVVTDRRPLVRQVIADQQADPPPVHLGHLMGPQFSEMFANLLPLVADGVLAPMQIVARKA